MEINTQLSQRDFIHASLTVLYRRPVIFIAALFLLLLLVVNVFLFLAGYLPSLNIIVLPVVLLFVTPFSTYMTARRIFKYNKAAFRPIIYGFEGTKMIISGEGYRSEKELSELRKVFKTAKWLFIIHPSKAVNPILLDQVSESQLAELKTILDANQVRNNL